MRGKRALPCRMKTAAWRPIRSAWFASISRDFRYHKMLLRLANLVADFPFNLPFFREQLT